MRSEEVADALRRTHSQPLSKLARWIVSRSIVTVQWRGQTLVPLFQFSASDWVLRPGVARALQSRPQCVHSSGRQPLARTSARAEALKIP